MTASGLFEPDRDALQQLIQVLQHADVPTNEAQKAVIEQLDHFSATVPALPGYLVYIFAVCTNESENVRLRAGLALKNNVTNKVAVFPPEILEYVKDTIFVALQDTHVQIRNTASSIVDWLFRSLGPSNWPEAIVRLLECMNSGNQAIQEVGMFRYILGERRS
jgi:transportin-1